MVRCLGAKTGEAELDFQFLPRRWYHVALSHSAGSALAPAWLRLHVNGALEASERLKYPKARFLCVSCPHSVKFLDFAM